MYNELIERLDSQKSQKINTSLVVFLAIVVIAYFANTSHLQIIRYLVVVTLAIFSFYLIMNTKKQGFAAAICIALGCSTIIAGILISNDVYYVAIPKYKFNFIFETISERMHSLQSAKEFLHLYSLFTGSACISLGLIFAYRPSIIQVRNHLSFEYPYPIWNSKNQPITQFSTNLVSTKKFLTDKERLLSCRFKYLLVSIGGELYLVSPNEKVPQDSIIMRTKSNRTLCGISRFR